MGEGTDERSQPFAYAHRSCTDKVYTGVAGPRDSPTAADMHMPVYIYVFNIFM